jgi:hypothetical protein
MSCYMVNSMIQPLISEAYSLNELVEILGFIETPPMIYLHKEIVKKLQEKDAVIKEYTMYQKYAEILIDNYKDKAYQKGQIGLIIQKALMFYEAGQYDAFKSELADADDYAYKNYFDDIVASLKRLQKNMK